MPTPFAADKSLPGHSAFGAVRLAVAMCVFVLATGIASSFGSVAHADGITDHLVAHWAFDETVAGSTAVDSAGSNDGTPTNSPAPSTDVPPVTFTDARSASFNGSNYFTFLRPVSDDFTICAWVKTTSTGGGVNHWTSAPILDSETGGVALDLGFGVGNGGKLMFGNGGYIGGSLVDSQVNGTTTINDNVWHDVCATRNDTSGEVDLYVDAQLDGSGVTGTGSLTSNPNARVGYGYDGAALFQGQIDDMRIYDVVLTTAQLTNLKDGSGDPDKSPLAPATTPADNATGVATGDDLALTFNRAPTASTGHIEIHRSDDDSTVETIAADDADRVSISGTTATINPTATLDTSTAYYVLVDADAFKDPDGNFYPAISGPADWNFTTVNGPPVINGANPDPLSLNEDAGPATVVVSATDDADTATLVWSVKTQPGAGTATLVAPGTGANASFSYTPDPGSSGSDSFVVEAADSAGAVDDFTVSVTVRPPNQPPVITPGSGNDDDGIDSSVEADAPNDGDANDDGVPDATQANVASFANPQTKEYVSVGVNKACALSAVGMASQNTGAGDAGFDYPVGLVNFRASCAVGATTTVTVYFYGAPGENLLLRKFNPSTNSFAALGDAALKQLTIGGKPVVVASYTVVDGGSRDSDGVANGIIVDPVGLAHADKALPTGGPPVNPPAPSTAAPELPYTGASGLVPLAGVAIISTMLGVFLVRAAHRRRID